MKGFDPLQMLTRAVKYITVFNYIIIYRLQMYNCPLYYITINPKIRLDLRVKMILSSSCVEKRSVSLDVKPLKRVVWCLLACLLKLI